AGGMLPTKRFIGPALETSTHCPDTTTLRKVATPMAPPRQQAKITRGSTEARRQRAHQVFARTNPSGGSASSNGDRVSTATPPRTPVQAARDTGTARDAESRSRARIQNASSGRNNASPNSE